MQAASGGGGDEIHKRPLPDGEGLHWTQEKELRLGDVDDLGIATTLEDPLGV